MISQNEIKKQSLFISLEFLAGALMAFFGWRFFSFPGSETLDTSIFYFFLTFYALMLLGVAVVGYFHYKSLGVTRVFAKALLLELLGLITFLLLYILFNSLIPGIRSFRILSLALPFIMPLTGAIIGMNYPLNNAPSRKE